jgi:hypothetical protein
MAKGNAPRGTVNRPKALGRALRAARGDRTQTEIGNLLGGIPQTTISRWEAGSVHLTVEQVNEVEATLGLEPGYLLRAGGYVKGEGMPGPPIQVFETTDLEEVGKVLATAELLGWGARVTNRAVPSNQIPGADVTQWEIRLHDRMPGGTL